MNRFLSLLAFLFSCSIAAAQPVQQSGTVTPGHPVMWTTNGVVQDAGTAVNGFLTGLGVVAVGPGLCQNSGPITGPYNQVCIIASPTGGGFTFKNVGGATGSPTFAINNQVYAFPFTPPATAVQGPNSTKVGDLAVWNNTAGTLLADVPSPTLVVTPNNAVSADVTINAAITSLSNGGTVDARSYGCAIQNVRATIKLVAGGVYGVAGPPIALLIDSCSQFEVDITNGTPAVDMGFNSALIATGTMTQANSANFYAVSSTNVSSFIENHDKTTIGDAGLTLRNIVLFGGNGNGAVIGKALLWIEGTWGVNVAENMQIAYNAGGCGILIDDNSSWGSALWSFYNMWVNTSAQEVCINHNSGGLGVQDLNFFGGAYESSTGSNPVVGIKTATAGIVHDIRFYGLYSENSNNQPALKIDGGQHISVDGWQINFSPTNCMTLTNASGGTTLDVMIRNVYCQGTNIINDQINGITLPQAFMSEYIYGDTAAPFAVWSAPGGSIGNVSSSSFRTGSNTITNASGINSNSFVPTILYSAAGTPVPTCNSSTHGTILVVQDQSALTFHANYDHAGSSITPVFCNGTNWQVQ